MGFETLNQIAKQLKKNIRSNVNIDSSLAENATETKRNHSEMNLCMTNCLGVYGTIESKFNNR